MSLAFLLRVEGLFLFLRVVTGGVSLEKGEGEGGADGDRELELQPLASQRLAEVHALGVQGGV